MKNNVRGCVGHYNLHSLFCIKYIITCTPLGKIHRIYVSYYLSKYTSHFGLKRPLHICLLGDGYYMQNRHVLYGK